MGEAKQRRLAKLAGKPWKVDLSKPFSTHPKNSESEGINVKGKDGLHALSLYMAAIGCITGGIGGFRRP